MVHARLGEFGALRRVQLKPRDPRGLDLSAALATRYETPVGEELAKVPVIGDGKPLLVPIVGLTTTFIVDLPRDPS